MSRRVRVLMVEDEKDWAEDLQDDLVLHLGPKNPEGPQWGIQFTLASSQQEADQAVRKAGADGFDLVLLDLAYPNEPPKGRRKAELDPRRGMDWLPKLRERLPRATIVIVSAHVEDFEVEDLVHAVRHGRADDFVSKSVSIREMVARIRVAFENARRRQDATTLAKEYHDLLQSLSLRVYAEDVGRLLQATQTNMHSLAMRVESDDPSAITDAPGEIRKGMMEMRADFEALTGALTSAVGTKRQVNLAEMARQVVLLYEWQAQGTSVRLIAPPETTNVFVKTYAGDVKLALHEVVRNALEAMAETKRRVGQIVEVSVVANTGRAQIVVRDTGGGFQPRVLDRLFTRDNTTRRGHTGLGLHVASRMMQAVGGDIECRNLPNKKGAEVVLTVRDLP